MTIDVQNVIVGLLSVVVALLSFGARELWNSQKELQKVVFDLKDELPQRYLHRDDFKTFRIEIMDAINRLEGYIRESLHNK
jgi:hypothetical protein